MLLSVFHLKLHENIHTVKIGKNDPRAFFFQARLSRKVTCLWRHRKFVNWKYLFEICRYTRSFDIAGPCFEQLELENGMPPGRSRPTFIIVVSSLHLALWLQQARTQTGSHANRLARKKKKRFVPGGLPVASEFASVTMTMSFLEIYIYIYTSGMKIPYSIHHSTCPYFSQCMVTIHLVHRSTQGQKANSINRALKIEHTILETPCVLHAIQPQQRAKKTKKKKARIPKFTSSLQPRNAKKPPGQHQTVQFPFQLEYCTTPVLVSASAAGEAWSC